MKRKSFIRSLLTLAVAPKLIAELNIPAKVAPVASSATLFGDLQLLTPTYYKVFLEKYGDQNFHDVMNAMARENPISASSTTDQFAMMMPKQPELGESAFKVEYTDVQETETGKVISWTVTPKNKFIP